MGGWTWGGGVPVLSCPTQSPSLPPSKPATPAIFPFSWGLRGLPIWGSLDLHRPILPAAHGVIAPHPHLGPDPSWLGSTSQGPLARSFGETIGLPPGLGVRNEPESGSGSAAAVGCEEGLGCCGNAASSDSFPERNSACAKASKSPRAGRVSPSPPKMPAVVSGTSRGGAFPRGVMGVIGAIYCGQPALQV